MSILSSTQVKQYLFLGIIISLAILLARNLFNFFPGVLGAVTLYILMRQWYFKLTVLRGWKKWVTALLFILSALVVFVVPFLVLGAMLVPKAMAVLNNTNQFSGGLSTIVQRMQHIIPGYSLSEEQIRSLMQKASASLPTFLGTALDVMSNLILCFFLLYFMLTDGRKLERKIQGFLPLKDENIDDIWKATRVMVISNAIGIPLLALFQAFTASLGYYFFGVHQWLLWGVLTGICSLLPVLGTAIIWAPLTVYLMATGHTAQGTGLLLFSVIFTVNIDNVLRFTLLKKLGDVHPIITVLGIIVGVPIFGFMGLIFGPLLISYFLLLLKIYNAEFSSRHLHRSDS